jgi:Ca-activated chloride channel family protein
MPTAQVKTRNRKDRKVCGLALLSLVLLILASLSLASGQAGRRPAGINGGAATLLNIVATHEGESKEPITAKQLALYDNGIVQTIRSFSPDPAPARIVLLVDNSLTIRADVDKLEEAAREFAYEIFEGDQILIVGYDTQAEIVADWTDDAKKIETSLKSFRKKGDPHLFDALNAVSEDALRPLAATTQKRIIVVISDGLDRGSKARFETILAELQLQDITVYAVQAPDRTGGALRRDQPKPKQVIEKLVEGTGGRVFSIDEPKVAAQAICDELRKNRYVLSYSPTNVAVGDPRHLLIIADEGINVRAKTLQPSVIR